MARGWRTLGVVLDEDAVGPSEVDRDPIEERLMGGPSEHALPSAVVWLDSLVLSTGSAVVERDRWKALNGPLKEFVRLMPFPPPAPCAAAATSWYLFASSGNWRALPLRLDEPLCGGAAGAGDPTVELVGAAGGGVAADDGGASGRTSNREGVGLTGRERPPAGRREEQRMWQKPGWDVEKLDSTTSR